MVIAKKTVKDTMESLMDLDVMELFHNGTDSLDNEYSMQVAELVKEYLSKIPSLLLIRLADYNG